MQEVTDLIACEECDAIHRKLALGHNEVTLCGRCGAALEQDMSVHSRRALPLAIACLLMFIVANAFPIVEMQFQGNVNRTTIIGAVLSLNAEGMPGVALLVLFTIILFPLLQLLAMMYLLIAAKRPDYFHPEFNFVARMVQVVRPWAMVEVFLLGTIVAYVKLTSMATVVPGTALLAFGVLTVLLAALVSFNPRYIWRMALQEKGRKQDAGK
ncbi:paraquat-inducible protein A [Nitrosospira sp. Nsp13]|jgi:paraquat-inducible protein A|uniref:paraquat-inducible protein A n=1 Tax=Nitrosospira sp. Nsp13 TaxID=1855332 RepID=UPI00088DA601|nr:paraquat-inducible protein A [Nitrosospira sp. Nsp13]SCY51073.1 paraquat-inducible protein A [Nitrosospira sp. Nsp13]